MSKLNENHVEEAALAWLGELGYETINGYSIEPDKRGSERASYEEVRLVARLRAAIARLNPTLTEETHTEALAKIRLSETPSLLTENRRLHRYLIEGVPLEVRRADGSIGGEFVRLVDFNDATVNDWLAVNQFTVIENGAKRRPDVVVFLNGLPLVVIELKNPGNETATLDNVLNQLQTCKSRIPSFFCTNAAKDWFVEFGPTRAKAEGRAPYLAPELWSRLPTRIDAHGKPDSWETQLLNGIATFLNGLAMQKYPALDNNALPIVKIADLRAGKSQNSELASSKIPEEYIVENGDILFSWSGCLLHRVWTSARGALNQHLFKATSSKFPKWLYFYWIDHYMESFRATAASKATTMGHIQRHHLAQAITIIPDDSVLKAADNLIAPLFERRITNDLDSKNLSQVRDYLLPKLMSGEIRIREAEKMVEVVL